MENAKLDYKATIDRLAEACKWKAETTNGWIDKGEAACGTGKGGGSPKRS